MKLASLLLLAKQLEGYLLNSDSPEGERETGQWSGERQRQGGGEGLGLSVSLQEHIKQLLGEGSENKLELHGRDRFKLGDT